MSWVLTFLGIAALIILHEFGHFAAAKAVGMRVERFSLFFGPMLVKTRRGETEYGIGPIPLGGYVKITGMNPNEEVSPEVLDRAYYRQPVWKRIVVISAGPAMNVLIAFLLLWAIFLSNGFNTGNPSHRVQSVEKRQPAAAVLGPGDRVLAVDGVADITKISPQISSHHCAQTPPVAGCRATTPALVTVQHGSQQLTVPVYPRYDPVAKRTRVGFAFGEVVQPQNVVSAAGSSVSEMWHVTTTTVSKVSQIFYSSQARKQINSVVGASDYTSQAFSYSTTAALGILALLSLSLAVINLFPFLPLDGGHIFWALAEKVRGRPIPFSVMERASVIGFGLVLFVFLIGFSNDIHTLSNGGFHLR